MRLEYYDSHETAKNGVGKRTIPLRDSTPIITTTGDKLHPYVFSFTSQIGELSELRRFGLWSVVLA